MTRNGTPDADVLIVGAGIAGLSAAWFAARAGRKVTIVDEGPHRASDLPIALINPLRGHTGRLIADGVEGLQASLALIDALRDAGHAVDGGRGVYRPLIGVAGETRDEAYWTARIGGRLTFDWHAFAPASLGLSEPVPALYLRDAAWVAPRSLLDALLVASGATVVVDRVTRVAHDHRSHGRSAGVASLAGGSTIAARTLLWCGGAWGAALLDRTCAAVGDPACAAFDDASYKPGSLVAVDERLTRDALSFGLYAAPWSGMTGGARLAGTLIGPTREGSRARFPEEPVPPEAIVHLGDRIARVFGTTMLVHPVWRGVRLVRLSTGATDALRGIATLTALGSRGFLMAPLRAAAWARSL